MFNYESFLQSIKRHWLGIVLITLLFALLAVVPPVVTFVLANGTADLRTYQAQAELYIRHDQAQITRSPESGTASRLMLDARHLVLSNEVAGEVRRTYGKQVTIESPYWKYGKDDQEFTTDFVIISVSAPSQDTAIQAADLAAELAKEQIMQTIPVHDVSISTPAQAVQATGAATNNFGSEDLGGTTFHDLTFASAISKKRLIVLVALGLVGSITLFACKDALSRRLYTRSDVERLLQVPVLAEVSECAKLSDLAPAFASLVTHYNMAAPALVTPADAELAHSCAQMLSSDVVIFTPAQLLDAAELSSLSSCDGMILLLHAAQDNRQTLMRMVDTINLLNVPVLGCIFVA